MLIRSRAGLLALILLYVESCILVLHVFASPLPVTPVKSVSDSNRRPTTLVHLGEHSSYSAAPGIYPSAKFRYLNTLEDSEDSQQQVRLLHKRGIFDKIKSGFQKAGQAIKSGVQKAGGAIKNAATNVASGVKTAATKVASTVKTAATKVASTVKTAATKVASTVKTAATKVASGAKTAVNKVASSAKSAVAKVGNVAKTAANKVAGGVKTAVKKVGNAAKTVASKVKSAVKTVGNRVKTAATKVAGSVKNVAKKIGNGVKNAANKVAGSVKTAANKVAGGVKTATKWVKQNGAKVAKFGLKLHATGASIASKVAKFIPGVGKPISTALKVESKLEDMASNAIHADLGSKLDTGMSVLDKIQHPISGVAGEVLDNLKRRTVIFERELF